MHDFDFYYLKTAMNIIMYKIRGKILTRGSVSVKWLCKPNLLAEANLPKVSPRSWSRILGKGMVLLVGARRFEGPPLPPTCLLGRGGAGI